MKTEFLQSMAKKQFPRVINDDFCGNSPFWHSKLSVWISLLSCLKLIDYLTFNRQNYINTVWETDLFVLAETCLIYRWNNSSSLWRNFVAANVLVQFLLFAFQINAALLITSQEDHKFLFSHNNWVFLNYLCLYCSFSGFWTWMLLSTEWLCPVVWSSFWPFTSCFDRPYCHVI